MRTQEVIHVPATEGRAVTVPSGQAFRIVDVEGKQVADLFAFNAADVGEHHSAMHTRAVVSSLFPKVGEAFVTNRRRPILALEADDTPAVHDMLIAPCDPERYQGLGVREWHASCRENLELAMRELGHDGICIPASINLFMNIPVDVGRVARLGPGRDLGGRLDHAAGADGHDRGRVRLPSGHRPDQRPQPHPDRDRAARLGLAAVGGPPALEAEVLGHQRRGVVAAPERARARRGAPTPPPR